MPYGLFVFGPFRPLLLDSTITADVCLSSDFNRRCFCIAYDEIRSSNGDRIRKKNDGKVKCK